MFSFLRGRELLVVIIFLVAAVVALAVYLMMFKFRDSELDLGYLFKLTQAKGRAMVPVFDQETQQWVNPFSEIPIKFSRELI